MYELYLRCRFFYEKLQKLDNLEEFQGQVAVYHLL